MACNKSKMAGRITRTTWLTSCCDSHAMPNISKVFLVETDNSVLFHYKKKLIQKKQLNAIKTLQLRWNCDK